MSYALKDAHPNRLHNFRAESQTSYAYPPAQRRNQVYCEGCQTHVPVVNKGRINKGWRCAPCRSKLSIVP